MSTSGSSASQRSQPPTKVYLPHHATLSSKEDFGIHLLEKTPIVETRRGTAPMPIDPDDHTANVAIALGCDVSTLGLAEAVAARHIAYVTTLFLYNVARLPAEGSDIESHRRIAEENPDVDVLELSSHTLNPASQQLRIVARKRLDDQFELGPTMVVIARVRRLR
jgi:hypothetical protein